MNYSLFIPILTAMLGLIGGYIVNVQLERKRKLLATKRDQLQFVYAPLEMLTRINKLEFDRYFDEKTSRAEKEFIEQQVWFPNNSEIKKILVMHAHLLDEMPSELYDLVAHINVWLSEYNLIYVLQTKDAPVFVAYKGHRYPQKADQVIADKAAQLRKVLNKAWPAKIYYPLYSIAAG